MGLVLAEHRAERFYCWLLLLFACLGTLLTIAATGITLSQSATSKRHYFVHCVFGPFAQIFGTSANQIQYFGILLVAPYRVNMDRQWLEVGKEIGLIGEGLIDFVREREKSAREDRVLFCYSPPPPPENS